MRIRKLLAAAALILPVLSPARAQSGAGEAAAVTAVLEKQQAAWNTGDVRGFMDGYLDSDSTTFVGTRVARGREGILRNYLERYTTREKMGTLAFSPLEATPLCAGYASVVGHWNLKRSAAAGGDAGGWFTLLFRRTAHGWKIILDHTSSQ